MKILQTFIILFFSLNAKVFAQGSCSVELFSKIYRLENDQTLVNNDIIQHSDCSNAITFKISQIISHSSGTVGNDFLKKELSKDFPEDLIEITPRKLSLLDLNLALRDQLTRNSNLYFVNTKSLNALKSLGLIEGEQLKTYCESCSSYGEKNIKIDISNPVANSTRTLWFSSQIMAKVKVFKAKSNLSFQQKNLQPEDFYSDEILMGSPDNVITSINNINFYKPNRLILQGSTISNLDLQPVNLITFGTPVNVTLKNQNIQLQKIAMPMRSAQFGETIELKNNNNNKIIMGKVVDYNKVVIEL
jgi:flagella basal body P-ring formation protein FlgA